MKASVKLIKLIGVIGACHQLHQLGFIYQHKRLPYKNILICAFLN
jgi:hypothetical protein